MAVGPISPMWLDRAADEACRVGDPENLDALEVPMHARFAERLHISKSLPFFLEFALAGVTKGSGLAFVAERLGFSAGRTVAFGDGENDVELLEWAGYAVAVENAHDRLLGLADLVCPSAEEEGVAQVIEAYLARSETAEAGLSRADEGAEGPGLARSETAEGGRVDGGVGGLLDSPS